MDSLKVKDLTQTGYTVDGFTQVLQGGQGRRRYF
ncbi:unnamed protein product [Brassica napus]|uniref:(rape) hypothetical protein n=1 Tax=Brassica napus TaxID=3708 RepID=A0A816IM17_BRANA|nr:unnamed protein product [Brassica napus]